MDRIDLVVGGEREAGHWEDTRKLRKKKIPHRLDTLKDIYRKDFLLTREREARYLTEEWEAGHLKGHKKTDKRNMPEQHKKVQFST